MLHKWWRIQEIGVEKTLVLGLCQIGLFDLFTFIIYHFVIAYGLYICERHSLITFSTTAWVQYTSLFFNKRCTWFLMLTCNMERLQLVSYLWLCVLQHCLSIMCFYTSVSELPLILSALCSVCCVCSDTLAGSYVICLLSLWPCYTSPRTLVFMCYALKSWIGLSTEIVYT